MDTRTKIISLEEAALRLREGNLLAVRLDCDPLLAPLAAALQNLGRPVLALLSERADGYLETRARMELAAGLAAVAYVAEGDLQGGDIVDLRGAEDEWRSDLEALVLSKSALNKNEAL